jgi:hypothetical protein
MSKDGFTLAWTDIWTLALTRPTPETYQQLLSDERRTTNRALVWLYFTSLLAVVVFVNSIIGSPQSQEALLLALAQNGLDTEGVNVAQALFVSSLCVAPFSAIFSVLGWMVLASVIQAFASQVGDRAQTAGKMQAYLYCLSAVVAPTTLLATFFTIVPLVSFLSFAVTIYQTYCLIRAAQGVYALEFRTAVGVVVAPVVAFFLLQLLFLGVAF